MDPLTGILLANVGASAFNNWRNSKQAKKMQQKQQEFALAAAERNRQRMWELMREGQNLAIEMEQEAHEARLNEINNEYDNLLKRLAYTKAIEVWPLKVLPIVMKNQSLGNLLTNKDENIAMHCILTPSNCRRFNAEVYPMIEQQVSDFCNTHWNRLSSHPVLFYSGAWQSGAEPTGVEIEQLKENLHNLPTLMITPFFKPKGGLAFQINVWGIGMDDIQAEIECEDFSYSSSYAKEMDYENDKDLRHNTIEEFVPYLQCLIGYIADQYFWAAHNEPPILPSLLELKAVNTDGMPYLREASTERYTTLLNACKGEAKAMPFAPEKMLTLLEGSAPLYDDQTRKQKLEEIFIPYYSYYDISGLLRFANAVFPLLPKEELNSFLSTLLSAICEIESVEYDNSMSYTELITKGNLWLSLSKEQIDTIETLYLSCKKLIDNDKLVVNAESFDGKSDKNKNRIFMDNKVYTEKRDELLKLLSEILKVKKLPKSHSIVFERIMHKIKEDQFSIALIGEYQGGKSTTFDALCGGREISPRGKNIKTSSCRIEVSSISRDKEEHATIRWRSNVEIVKTISSLLGSIDPTLLGYDESSKKKFSYEEYINLDDKKHIKLIKDAIDEEARKLDEADPSIKDIILIGRFIVYFYDKTKTLRDVSECSIEEASNIMTFPEKMMERYNTANGDVSIFTPKEALFAFVQTVKCYIHSRDLERLGCTIIDCPGLFASDYDTSIALDTIIHSDAVLYLLNGEKQYSMGDQNAINTIYKLGKIGRPEFDGRNVFFAINQRKSIEQTSFVNLNLSMINETGFKKDKLPMYNALLYFYAQFGRNYLNGYIDQISINKFLSNSKKAHVSVDDKWVKDVSKILVILDLDEDYEIETLTMETVDLVSAISQSGGIFTEIEDYIVKEKAHSILVDNGAVKILNGLKAVESVLQQQEALARKDVAQRVAEYQKARAELGTFLKKTDQILSESFDDDVLREFVGLAYGRYFIDGQLVSSISFEITKTLLEYMKKNGTRWDAIASKLAFKEEARNSHVMKLRSEITAIFTNAFKSGYSPVIEKWVKCIYEGKDEAFKLVMLKEASRLAAKLEKEWQLAVAKIPILQSLTPIDTTLDLAECTKKNAQFSDEISPESIGKTVEMTIDDMIVGIISYVISVVIGTAITIVLDGLLSGGLATLVGMITSALTYIGFRSPKEIKTPDDFNKKGRQLYDMINSNIFIAMSQGATKAKICYSTEGLILIASQLGDSFKLYYSNQLVGKTEQLEGVIADAERQYSVTRDKLGQIASEAKDIRTKEVEPLRNKVQLFINNTNNEQ